MKSRMALAFVGGVVVTVAVPLLMLALGLFDWSASTKPGPFETSVAEFALDRSLQSRAPKVANPAATAEDAAMGLNHYRENCVFCHGGPGVKRSEAGRGLNPPAPGLADPGIQQLSDGQLFWITRNGIRMSGMPAFGLTHTDKEVWQIVSFLRKLPSLSEAEKHQLKGNATEEGEHHHD